MKKLKIKFKRTWSMKIPLILCFLLVSLIPLMVQARFLTGFFSQTQIDDRMVEAQNKCLVLTNKLVSSDYVNNPSNNPSLDTEMRATADFFNGRIVVIDENFRIIKDTFDLTKGKLSVAEEVLKAFEGETISHKNKGKQYFSLTIPVYSKTDRRIVNGVLLMTSSTENITQMENTITDKAVFFQMVLLWFIMAVVLLMAALLLKPFRHLQSVLNQVADGNLDQDIQVTSYKETRGISDAVSQTLRKLKAVDQSRQEFVSNVSHELKTPITSIRVLADSLMSMEDAPVELYREFMTDISDEIDREGKIIDDLLTLVKMDKSSPDLNITPININALMEQILKRLRPIAKKRNIELVFESIREVMADVDEVKLSLALNNLVENAVKYNYEDGLVRVILDADHKFFYVKVVDNGVGIPTELQEHIFERFYRVDKARSRETGGTGLGLAITKSIVIMHRGAIKLQSKEGEGTTFTVRIPLNYIP
ncbi:MAG: ATP-binding protein [Clostridium sp.]